MKQKSILFALATASTAFLVVQAGAVILPDFYSNSYIIASEALRLFLVAGILGIMVPVIEGRKLGLAYDHPSSPNHTKIGIIFSIAAVAVEIALFSSWFTILRHNPDDIIRIKHILMTLPISIAISLLFFFIVPSLVESTITRRPASRIITIILSGAAMGFSLFAETGFARINVFAVMTLVGSLAAAGHLFTGKFFLTFLTIFLAIYANSLAELRYVDCSWPVVISGFIFCIGILVTVFIIPVKHEAAAL